MAPTERPFERIYRDISRLSRHDKYSLVMKIVTDLDKTAPLHAASYDFFSIKGLGKEIWEDEDAQDYVNRERDSWK